MESVTPTLSETRGTTPEPSSLQETRGSEGSQDQNASIFSGVVAALTFVLVVTVLCVLCNRNKRKKRRRQSRSARIFSTESLLSRSSESTSSAHVPSQAGSSLQLHRARAHAAGYPGDVCDKATRPLRTLTRSAQHDPVGAGGACPSISSEDSRDYLNVLVVEDIPETLASTSTLPRDLFVISSAQELQFPGDRDEGCGSASKCTRFGSPGAESSDSLSDEGGSSQTSNDYVNMAGLDLRAIQGQDPWVSPQCCRDYENVPRADPSRSQQQAEEVTSSDTDRGEGRTDGLGTRVQLVMQSGRVLDLEERVNCQPSAQSEGSQMTHGEEVSSKDSDDYENMQAVVLGTGAPSRGQTQVFFLTNYDPAAPLE